MRRRPGVFFQLHGPNIRAEQAVDFPRELRRHVRRHVRRTVLVVRDLLGAPRKAARLQKEAHPDWFDFEFLPAYAPELNPVEQLWNPAEHSEPANVIPEDLGDLHDLVEFTTAENRPRTAPLHSFLSYAKLKA